MHNILCSILIFHLIRLLLLEITYIGFLIEISVRKLFYAFIFPISHMYKIRRKCLKFPLKELTEIATNFNRYA